jgi:hypothetical protein
MMGWAIRSILLVAAAAAWAGASTAPAAAEAAAPAKATRAPKTAPAGRTTLSITRSSDMLYLGMAASVEINGQKVASLERGETFTSDVAAGPLVLRVSNWSSPGATTFSLRALPGKTYRFTVSPHSGNFVASLAGGFVGAAIEGRGPFEIAPAP